MEYQEGPILNVLDDPEVMRADLMHILECAQGRRFIRRVFQNCGVFAPLPVQEPLQAALLEGRRSMGLLLFEQVKACGVNYITKLLQEDMNNV